jgi:hypothetical protein
VDRSWEYINRSQTHECGNWHRGRAIPRKGIHKWDFLCSVDYIVLNVSGLHGVECVWSPWCLVKNGVKFIFGLHGLKCVWCDVCIEGVKCVRSTRYEVCCQHGMKRSSMVYMVRSVFVLHGAKCVLSTRYST